MPNDTDIFGAGVSKAQDDSAIFKDIANHQPVQVAPVMESKPGDPREEAYQAFKAESQKRSENFAYEAGGKVTDITGSPALGAAANFVSNAVPSLFGAQLGTVANPVTQGIARWLMRSALKPSSQVPLAKANNAVETLLKEGVNPTEGGVDKLRKTLGGLNQQVDEAVAKSGATVDAHAVADYVPSSYDRFKNGPAAVQAAQDLGKCATHIPRSPEHQRSKRNPCPSRPGHEAGLPKGNRGSWLWGT
jgi:hypothetical protein